ncbi:MAG: response regulator, partial [Desulfobacteraceae bacterium]|nr:response regulator [Desulfobacteraceae bacterium]
DLQARATITKASIEKYISMIQHSAVRASEMVQQLFSISQDREQDSVMIDLNFCVKHVVKLAKNSFDKSITIKPIFHDKPAKIMGNPMQIEQVLLNLFINAAHSMTLMRKNSDPWGGILDVSVSSSSLTKKSDKYWKILIKDTGVGIPETLYSKIFSPFFTTKAVGKGTGLGLSMVQNIVKQHQGHIIFDSTPGKGTEFHLHLPVSHDKSKEQTNNKETDIIHGTGTVMIVDDETILVNTVCTMLTICGYNPISASNGKQALKIFQNNFKEINCVILDLSMPYLSGIEIFNQMKAINPEVRVILTTGYNTDERINRMLDLGAKGVLKKPFNIAALSNIVGKTLK